MAIYSGFIHEKWWFSIVFCMFTRGYVSMTRGYFMTSWLNNLILVLKPWKSWGVLGGRAGIQRMHCRNLHRTNLQKGIWNGSTGANACVAGKPKGTLFETVISHDFPLLLIDSTRSMGLHYFQNTPKPHQLVFLLEKPSVVAEKVWILLSCPQFRWFCRWPELFDLRNLTHRYWKSTKFGASSLIIELDGGISKSAMPAMRYPPGTGDYWAVWAGPHHANESGAPTGGLMEFLVIWHDLFQKGSFWDFFGELDIYPGFWHFGFIWILGFSWFFEVFCMFWRFSAQGHPAKGG